ncbi:MGH1-like glycoside hydrolase domain-containing protein [Dinghuibacter silviterrae]|uniref:Mannosylglycerate hydrolase MGH1-like glycoside hydrolase domain-containing protein n=1 Tax=Dinghuibacter silviterrae TaxID=1539049 RepID=A0A4R8DUX3_9BACT|nr:glucosidase [Dinghuibacter silviterrae]TDX00971.1 hypothetical protein EDB95_2002 [Dinghuibacter silviterrae]
MNEEQARLSDPTWKKWGPYLSARQWGTVREDYSEGGDAWSFTTHDMARSKTYRWGEEGIAGFCDDQQLLCLSLALWNEKDPILKEVYFGLSNKEGNHGEDVKELFYYLDGTPTHSYMKMLYKYPQSPFPYDQIRRENAARTRNDPEFELMDTGVFDKDEYFDVFVEYAKAGPEDILIRIHVENRGPEAAALRVLPTAWFRNTWNWGYDAYKPVFDLAGDGRVSVSHRDLKGYYLYAENPAEWLFCDNETNTRRLYGYDDQHAFPKDGINDHVVQGAPTVNPGRQGTKVAAAWALHVGAGQSATVRLRLAKADLSAPFFGFDDVITQRIAEADRFYQDLQFDIEAGEKRMIHRQALAGMLWNKQFYYYNVQHWLDGDPAQPAPPAARKKGRNSNWKHVKAVHIISMPDKWEYPWFAAWDLAFHTIAFTLLDTAFAKNQLYTLTREWFMHPNGQLPAYEWNFSDANPPVHAWAVWRVYQFDAKQNGGKGDLAFLEKLFHKLLVNFTWWVNRKDAEGNNIFEGGFLGLDNIGVFDRDIVLPQGQLVEQADGTAWMAMYCLNMLRISLELSKANKNYVEMANKFFAHFLYIASALESLGDNGAGLWDDEDQFFYDQIRAKDGTSKRLKVRSLVGMIPLLAVEVIDDKLLRDQPEFQARMNWFLENRPDLAKLVSRFNEKGDNEKRLLGLVRIHRMKAVLQKMLDEAEFLSPHGIRSVSKYHLQHPYQFPVDGQILEVKYLPAESDSALFGGNSNWRGPVWMPINTLLIEALQRYHYYYGDGLTIECPTGSGQYLNLHQIAQLLCDRLIGLFQRDASGRRAVFGNRDKLQNDPHFRDYILYHEYFHGDNGTGLGASHQTGWTGMIAKVIQPRWPMGAKDDMMPTKDAAQEAHITPPPGPAHQATAAVVTAAHEPGTS